jgi:hypothetical protein
MTDQNKKNLVYFEANTMRELYDSMEEWQNDNGKRLLSTQIQRDADKLCCIALTNPSEVIICNGAHGADGRWSEKAVVENGGLKVWKS